MADSPIIHFALPECGSTNDVALDLLQTGHHAPFWVSAERQTQARGRLGRPWQSMSGNLHATLVWPKPQSFSNALASMALAVGLGVRAAILSKMPQAKSALQLKWPNDLLLEGAKCGGILIEAHSALLIGIGVNIAQAPTNTPYKAACLHGFMPSVSVIDVLTALRQTLPPLLKSFAEEGFAALKEQWLHAAYGLGQRIVLEDGQRRIVGLFKDIDSTGCLVLENENGDYHAHSGSLRFLI
jgi:BirA family transcriptional regulator, biotin operon repressor / biotin---[acetyl-CoA-carboxylase] ligase